jgi:hypothetical protein
VADALTNDVLGSHFSPLGAFDEDSDRVLVLDVARFKYRPHWVAVADLWRAMDTEEKTSDGIAKRRGGGGGLATRNSSRTSAGFLELSASDQLQPPLQSRMFALVGGRGGGSVALIPPWR